VEAIASLRSQTPRRSLRFVHEDPKRKRAINCFFEPVDFGEHLFEIGASSR